MVESDTQREPIVNFIKSKTIDAEITNLDKDTILKFAHENKVELPEDFWNVGNLTKTQSLFNPMLGGGGPTYNGTDEEKERYDKLEDLYWKIEELNEYIEYFSAIDNYQLIKLVLANLGTDIDEDIILIHVSYLKHHTTVAFPSALVFTSAPESIEYEITSKHTADVLMGTLEIS